MDLSWVHTFPCRYGNAVEGSRDGSWSTGPLKGSPFSADAGMRWLSTPMLEDLGEPPGVRLNHLHEGWYRNLHRTGIVVFAAIVMLPVDRLTDAVCLAESLLAPDPYTSRGLREWAPAYAVGESGRHVGLHLLFNGVEAADDRHAFAETVGGYWFVDYGYLSVPPTPAEGEWIYPDRLGITDLPECRTIQRCFGGVYLLPSDRLYRDLPELRAALKVGRPRRRSQR